MSYNEATLVHMDLSVIIVSFNTKELTLRCLRELDHALIESPTVHAEVIVVDNASTDGSSSDLSKVRMIHAEYLCIRNSSNVGFSKANNRGLQKSKGRYILFLNSDVLIGGDDGNLNFTDLIQMMDSDDKIGALTVRVELPNGEIDKASHRGFPTLWRSLTYFMGMENLIQKLRITNYKLRMIFGGYHLLERDLTKTYDIESGTAAFLLCRGTLLRELNGFDEQFFMYGEDLDICFQIVRKGYRIVWYPQYKVTHLKYQSGLGSRDKATQRRIRWHFFDAMERFYRKHYHNVYPKVVTWVVYKVLKFIKFIKYRA
jgi:GT2 family glycosyltransferase